MQILVQKKREIASNYLSNFAFILLFFQSTEPRKGSVNLFSVPCAINKALHLLEYDCQP